MADATASFVDSGDQDPLTVKSLQTAISNAMQIIETNLSEKLEKLFMPIQVQLTEIQASLAKTSQVAETALAMGVSLQDES